MKTKRLFIFPVLFLLFVVSSSLWSTEIAKPPISYGEGPKFVLDHAIFRGVDNRSYVEFYLQVAYDELQFIKFSDGFRAEYKIELAVQDETGMEVEHHIDVDVVDVDIFSETNAQNKARVSLVAFTLDPGIYIIETKLTDIETRYISTLTTSLSSRSFQSSQLQISDLQISQNIVPAENRDSYVKNQRYVEPNPMRMFSPDFSQAVYIYFEIYNLKYSETSTEKTYTAKYIFHNIDGKKIAELKRKGVKPGDSSANSLRFPLEHFKSGDYRLTVQIEDAETHQVVEATNNFTIIESLSPYVSVSL